MPYTDLLRVSVFITAAEATALGAITAVAANRDQETTIVLIAAGWWLVSLAIGFWLSRPERADDDVRDALARAKTATSLPDQSPARIAFTRLWPIALTAIAAGVLGIFFPGEAAVLGIEQRDGVKFYVVPSHPLKPIELVRTPGLRSDELGAF